MGAFVLFHVVFPGESFPAGRTVDVLLAGVLLAMTGSVAGGGERVSALEVLCMRAGKFLLRLCRGCSGIFGGAGARARAGTRAGRVG